MSKTNTSSREKTKRISTQLLMVLVPMIALFIIIVAAIVFLKSQSIIVKESKIELQVESAANANDISSMINGIKGYYDGLADAIQCSSYADNEALLKVLEKGTAAFSDMVHDCYIGLTTKEMLDGSGWVPDADYDPTTRGWYQNGSTSETIKLASPSLDMDTQKIVVCGSRSI